MTTIMMMMMLMFTRQVMSHTYAVHDHPSHPYFREETDSQEAARKRRLNTFIPIEQRYTDASLASSVGRLRVKFVWDLVDDLLENPDESDQTKMRDPALCRAAGDTVDPCRFESSGSNCAGSCQSYTCEQDDVITSEKVAIAKEHAEWVTDYLADMLYVTSVNGSIDFSADSSAQRCYNWDKGNSSLNLDDVFVHDNTDVVILMTMHKSQDGVAGYASCGKYDDSNRCIVGNFNWCPDQVDVANTADTNVIQYERTTFLHEVMHVLGCCSGDQFIDSSGAQRTGSNRPYTDTTYDTGSEGFSKAVRMFHSDRVLKTARTQWDCDDLEGVPLEDVPLGAGSHWEARVLGSEVMSYGSGSGEQYLSDITLAYLEDSGHFVAARNYFTGDQYTPNNNAYLDNYTYAKGGRLLEATGAGISKGGITAIAEFFGWAESRDVGEAKLRSPGHLRWGSKRGCDWFEKRPQVSWDDTYLCDSNAEAGCTGDNRMSARCSIQQWTSVSTQFSCLRSGNCPTSNSESPNLPLEYRYLDEDANAGGYNNAMDYVPIRVGYSNCLDKKPLTSSSQGVAGNASIDFSGLFNSLATDLEQFGGQQYGSEARCFPSTLREFGSVLSLDFTSYGLCYASNCYSEDYLQIGIRGRDGGTEWFGCPRGGGTLYIAGFSGSITCPNATEFCLTEDITGVFMTETEVWAAWVIVGTIVGIPLILILIVCCCPKIRKKFVICTKNLCGVELDYDEQLIQERIRARKNVKRNRRIGISSSNTTRQLAAIDTRAMAAFRLKVNRAYARRARCETRILFWINCIWTVIAFVCLMIGLTAIGGIPAGLENTAPLLITVAIFITIISSCGCSRISTGRPSLKLLAYFYISLFGTFICIVIGVMMLAYQSYLDSSAEQHWYAYRIYAPKDYQNLDIDEAEVQFEQDAGFAWKYMLYGLFGFVSFSCLAGAASSGYVLTWKNLLGNIFILFNLIFVLSFGIIALTLGIDLLEIDLLKTFENALFILTGVLCIFSVCVGIVGDWMKIDRVLTVYQCVAIISACSCILLSSMLYSGESDIRDKIQSMDDAEKAQAAEIMGLDSTTSTELEDLLIGTLKTYGVMSIVVSFFSLILALLSRYIVRLHAARLKLLSDWAKSCARADELGVSRPIAPDCSFLNLVRTASQRDALSTPPRRSVFNQQRSDVELVSSPLPVVSAQHVDQLPQACAIELADLPDDMEFPGPPPEVPQGENIAVAVPEHRPEPVPPVQSRPVSIHGDDSVVEERKEDDGDDEEKQGDAVDVDIESI